MAIEVRDITDKTEWDEFVTAHPEANFLHAWQWGEFHASTLAGRAERTIRVAP